MMKHETNTFSPIVTDWNRFKEWGAHLGDEIPKIFKDTRMPIAAYMKIANNLGKKKKHSGQPDLEENVVKNHDGKAAPYGSGYKKVDDEEINEIGVFPIQNYLSGIIPPGRLDVVKKGDKEKAIALIKDLVYTLNDFWKSHKIPFRVREPRKSDMNKFKQKNKRF